MSYKIKTIPYFDRHAKRLARKFKSFKTELSDSIQIVSIFNKTKVLMQC